MTDHAKALAATVRRFIDSAPIDDDDRPYICDIMQSEFEDLQKSLAAYDTSPAEAAPPRHTNGCISNAGVHRKGECDCGAVERAEAATRENGEDVLEAIDRELSRWACHRAVIEAVKDRVRAALSTHQQQGGEDK